MVAKFEPLIDKRYLPQPEKPSDTKGHSRKYWILFGVIAVVIIGTVMTQVSDKESLEYQLAYLNAGHSVSRDDPSVARFRRLLKTLESKTFNTQQEIADMTVRGQELLKERYGKKVKLFELMEAASSSIPFGLTMRYEEVMAALTDEERASSTVEEEKAESDAPRQREPDGIDLATFGRAFERDYYKALDRYIDTGRFTVWGYVGEITDAYDGDPMLIIYASKDCSGFRADCFFPAAARDLVEAYKTNEIAIVEGRITWVNMTRSGSTQVTGCVFPITSAPAAEREESVSTKQTAVLPSYRILDEETYDAPIKTQVAVKLLVSGEITQDGLKELLGDLYQGIMAREGFKYHESPTNVYIYAYTSKARAESGSLWIAMLDKSYSDSSPTISINERQLALLGQEPETRFGLTEEQRITIFWEIVRAEDRASAEAMAKYPDLIPGRPGYSQEAFLQQLDRQFEEMDQLEERYKEELATKYGLTREQLKLIVSEGLSKDWPTPSLP